MTIDEAKDWLDRYYAAWRTADAQAASLLFAPDALYVVTPYEEPWPAGERMKGRAQIAEFWHWVLTERIRFLDGGHDLWAVNRNEAYARWWADIELRGEGCWVPAEGVFKLSFSNRIDGHLVCDQLQEWNPIEPESARHYEPHPKDRSG
ncbi:MAG: nuclear transport factor 2 family protein [Acidimicrobiia bacterium]|nr:nuclear transport factor 2 family protein [Acidimicrobiia bacterium]